MSLLLLAAETWPEAFSWVGTGACVVAGMYVWARWWPHDFDEETTYVIDDDDEKEADS